MIGILTEQILLCLQLLQKFIYYLLGVHSTALYTSCGLIDIYIQNKGVQNSSKVKNSGPFLRKEWASLYGPVKTSRQFRYNYEFLILTDLTMQ